jgi:AraC-like DNA-binding protein
MKIKHFTYRKLSKGEVRNVFEEYERNPNLKIAEMAKRLEVSPNTLRKGLKEEFGEEYSLISKERSKTSRKVTDEQVKDAFERYKNGEHTTKIAQQLGIKRVSLQYRMKKIIGKEYRELAKRRCSKDAGLTKQKVSDTRINEAFEKYKKDKISLSELAESLCINQSSLIERFDKKFGKEYKRIARSKKEKITKERCIRVFKRYKNTNISLAQLSDELEVEISSLRERFLKLFGGEYREIAAKRGDLNEVFRRGRTLEELVFEYFRLLGKDIRDVRGTCIFKGTRKRVDFLIDDTFVEVKYSYVCFSKIGTIKGYKEILSDYLEKQINNSNKIVKSGIIVSLSGFSRSVIKQSGKDGIRLIGYKELRKVFEKNKRADLILKLNELKLCSPSRLFPDS